MKSFYATIGGLLLVACGTAEEVKDVGVIVRDSAGVQIVENKKFQEFPEATWLLSAAPVLEIGVVTGEPALMFSRISRPRTLPDGSIVAVDIQSSELRFFDRSGQHLRSVGRAGEGPGEFLSLVIRNAEIVDSLYIWDSRLSRLTIMSLEGELGRTVRLDRFHRTYPLEHITPLSDGSIFAVSSDTLTSTDAPVPWRLGSLIRFDADGGNPVAFGDFDYQQCSPPAVGGEFGDLSCGGFMPFGASGGVVVRNDRIYVSRPDRDEIRVLDENAALIRIIRGAAPQPVFSDETKRGFLDSIDAAGVTFEDSRDRRLLSPEGFPERIPGFQAFLVSEGGGVWTREYLPNYSRFMVRDTSTAPIRWMIYNPEGAYLGSVSVPKSFTISEIGDDYLLGVSQDELGVQRIAMYELIGP